MRAVVVFESMYGNTREVAEAIGSGLGSPGDVLVVPVSGANPELLEGIDLLVVGGPTHAHGMSRPATRHAAVDATAKADNVLTVDADAGGPGLREWFDTFGQLSMSGAAFDTRVALPVLVTGRASMRIRRELRHHGIEVVVPAESFVVDKANRLEPGEQARARAWGAQLAREVAVHLVR